MIKKLQSPIPGHVRVVFELPSCLWADRVFLSGDFNSWRAEEIQLRQDRNGVWRTMLDLPVGRRYEFRYLIDGEWRTDFHADGQADNQYGSQNSLVIAELDENEQEGSRTGAQVHERAQMRTQTVSRSASLNVVGQRKRRTKGAPVTPAT